MAVQDTDKNMLALRDLGEVLARHFGITDGLWEVAVEFQLAVGAVGPNPKDVLPGTMVGVSKVGLTRAKAEGPLVINAAALASDPAHLPTT